MKAMAALAVAALALAACAQAPATLAAATQSAVPPAPASMRVTSAKPATVSGAQEPPAYTALAVSPAAIWVAGPGFLDSSSDGGASWQSQPVSGVTASEMTFVDATHGWLYGTMIDSCKTSSSCTYTLLATTDGGRSWQPRMTMSTDQLSNIEFVDPATGFAVRRPQKPCSSCAVLVRTT
ncbi:MAG TPA: hypothetical protein VNM16_01145, partial [Bacillota bacterium]|nr:hypothetical protein [Bacillota bacterium]